MISTWTGPEFDLVESLTWRIRLAELGQIHRGWWPDMPSQRALRRHLCRLRKAKLLFRTFINVCPLPVIRSPLIAWEPNVTDPCFERVRRQIRGRWLSPAQPTEVYWASPQAANLFGSAAGELPPLSHREHDLLLAEVYVFYRLRRPQLARRWAGEDALPKAGYRIKNPDAFLLDDQGQPLRIIESSGHYSMKQIQSFHEHCAENNLPYELW